MRAAPSPRGTNKAALFLPAGFPSCSPGAAYDQAPEGFLGRACKWMAANGCSTEDIIGFIEHMDGGGEGEDAHATSAQHDAMERAAHQGGRGDNNPMGLDPDQRMTGADRLPGRKSTGMPRHAMDEIASNMRRIQIGPLGY